MLTKPVDQLTATDPAGREIKHKALLGIHGRIELGAVEDKERFHGGMPHALVAIDEGVALNQREAECRTLLDQAGVQVDATERGLGLGDRGFKHAEVTDTWRATGHLEEAPVQLDNLPNVR